MSVSRTVALGALLLANSSCAWTNRDNRPVWNAFEENLVPDNGTAFALTLPLTIPAGLVAIATDTFVVHPIAVVDDALDDTADLWRDIDWEKHYYTSLGALPFRALATPGVFVVSFLGRSAFDVDPHRTSEQIAAEREKTERGLVTTMQNWLASLRDGGHRELYSAPPSIWSEDLQRSYEDALAHANALGRAVLLRAARHCELPPFIADPWRGLRDPDPLIRAQELEALRDASAVPGELRDALLQDPVESVRLMAAERLRPKPGR